MKSGSKEKRLKDNRKPSKNDYVLEYNREAYRNSTKTKYLSIWSHNGSKSHAASKGRRRGNAFPVANPGVVSDQPSPKRAVPQQDSNHRPHVNKRRHMKQPRVANLTGEYEIGSNLQESPSNISFIFPNTTEGWNSSIGLTSQMAVQTPSGTTDDFDTFGVGVLSFTTPLIALFIFGILAIGVCIARKLTDKREKNFYYTINEDVKTDDSYLQAEGNFEMGPYGIDYDV